MKCRKICDSKNMFKIKEINKRKKDFKEKEKEKNENKRHNLKLKIMMLDSLILIVWLFECSSPFNALLIFLL